MTQVVMLTMLCVIFSLFLTPLIIKLAYKLNITDKPNYRKMHKSPIPTLGGLVIFMSFILGLIILRPTDEYHLAIMVGAIVIVGLGMLDDIYDLSAKVKFITQIVVAAFVVLWGGLEIEFINLPFGGDLDFGFLSPVITMFWIVGITNAMNLIDGLDGLAAGVSSIALATISGMAIIMGDIYVTTIALLLLFSTVGFLRYNFFPAKIFMGDTGALFLGYMISVLALLGFKNVTFISFVIPIFILGVPISDTLIAMVRRFINRQPITKPDSSHLHHCLLRNGYTHKQSVLFIYAISALFSVAAILFSMATIWGAILIFAVSIISMQILIESLGLINSNFKPLTNFYKTIRLRHK